MSIDVAIIGGGVSGLATAWELNRKGYSTLVLERQVRIGGHAFSDNIGGFIMEHGPSTINAFDAHAQAVTTSLDLARDQIYLGDGLKRRYLVGDGKLKGVAVHPFGFLTSDYLSLGGRMRMMMEPFIGRDKSGREQTIRDYSVRRFGREFADRVIDPLVGGLYAGRASELSMASVFPQMLALEQKHGSVVMGMIARKTKGGAMPGKRLFSWRGGIGALPAALAQAGSGGRSGARAEVSTGVTVRAITRDKDGYRIDCGASGPLQARAVVVATQPHVAAGLLEDLDPIGAEAAASIDTPPLAVVFLGYRRGQVDHPLDGLGFLAAEEENIGLTGVQFSSTMFAGRAPEGCVALTAYIGGARRPDLARLPEDDLIALAHHRLGVLLGIRGAPLLSRVRHWNLGLPQYHLGHHAIVEKLENADRRSSGLFLSGNYLSGPSVAACLSRARDTAEAVAEFMAGGAADHQQRDGSNVVGWRAGARQV